LGKPVSLVEQKLPGIGHGSRVSTRRHSEKRERARGMATATEWDCPREFAGARQRHAWITCEDTMTREHHAERPKAHTRQEQTIDEMVDETFPASDATQLPGRAAGAPDADAERPDPKREFRRGQPGTIGNQGVPPSTRMKEERVSLGGDAVVTFRFDND